MLRRPLGTAIGFSDVLKNLAGVKTNATTYTIIVKDKDGATVDTITMAAGDTGEYTGSWQSAVSDPAGVYSIQRSIVFGSYTTLIDKEMAFELY